MRWTLILAVMLLTVPAAVADDGAREETEPYTGAISYASTSFLQCYGYAEDVENIGGACFDIQDGETRVDISLTDDLDGVSGHEVGAFYAFTKVPEGTVGPNGLVCGSATDLEIPDGYNRLIVHVADPYLISFGCGAVAAATTGTITATFTTHS